MKEIDLYTIGFTKKRAEQFFEELRQTGVRRLIDVRLNNVSQLAGFTKRDDLRYFLKVINGIDYVHRPDFAPSKEILDAFKKDKGEWQKYENDFLALLRSRKIEKSITREELSDACLLCSESSTEHCHRRLVAEYLQQELGNMVIRHL